MRRIALAFGLLLLLSCGDPAPEEGFVTQKKHTPEYTHWHDGGSTCVIQNKNGVCTVSIPNPDRPHEHCVGGCWQLKLEDCKTDDKGKEKCRRGWIDVDEDTYGDYKVGSHYPNPK